MGEKMSLFKNEQGIAMTEGVIVIPFFLVIWFGIFAVYCAYTARLDARGEATRGAYAQAMSGECDNFSFNDDNDAPETGFSQHDDDKKSEFSIGEDRVSDNSGILNAAKDMNPLIFQHVNASARVTHEIYGRKKDAIASRLMLCNSKPTGGILDLIKDSLKGLIGLD